MSTEREDKPDLPDILKSQSMMTPKRAAAMDDGDRAQGVESYDDPADGKARSARPKVADHVADAGTKKKAPAKKAPAKKAKK